MRRRGELAILLGVIALAGWLRLRALDLAEFKADEARALELAQDVLDGGSPPPGSSRASVRPTRHSSVPARSPHWSPWGPLWALFVILERRRTGWVARAVREPIPWADVGIACTVGLTSAGYVAFTLDVQRYVDRAGGTAGDYGAACRHSAALASFAATRGLAFEEDDDELTRNSTELRATAHLSVSAHWRPAFRRVPRQGLDRGRKGHSSRSCGS